MYRVDVLKTPQRDIRKLPPDEIPGIIKKIYALKHDPKPFGCEKLTGYKNGYRIPKGDYRIVYTIDDKNKVVAVQRVRHRREVYRGL